MIRILIDLRPLLREAVSGETSRFILTAYSRIISANPENEWYILADIAPPGKMPLPIPGSHWITKKSFSGGPGWKHWYDWQVPLAVRRLGIDLFIATGGACSRVRIPQCVWMGGVMTSQENGAGDRSFIPFYKKRIRKTLEKSGALFVFSENLKRELVKKSGIPASKLFLLPAAAGADYQTLSWPQKENIKIGFAGGREYFVLAGTPVHAEAMGVLKAFSQFKKRQQSNMQLFIAVNGISRDALFTEKLSSYKYRSDLRLFDGASDVERREIISGAYAVCGIVPENEPFNVLLEACKAGVPVITLDRPDTRQIMGEAALYTEVQEPESLASLFNRLYIEESLRKRQIGYGLTRAGDAGWAKIDSQIIEGISVALNKKNPNNYSQ